MKSPSAPHRVRPTDGDGEFVISYVDFFALPEESTLARSQLMLEAAGQTLESSLKHLRASHDAVDRLCEMLRSTQESIRASHECLVRSDRLIARAQFGFPEEGTPERGQRNTPDTFQRAPLVANLDA